MLARAIAPCLVLVWSTAASAQDHPHFFITAARETAWAQMKTDYDANPSAPATTGGRMYAIIKRDADSGIRYGDTGMRATWMYHVTGDTAYVTKAWTQINARFLLRAETCNNSGLSGDFSRENSVQYVTMYDWLYSGLTAQQRTDFMDKINLMVACVNAPSPAASYALGTDSDQTTGEYLGLAMWYLATNSYNVTVGTIWNDATRLIGGLTATGANYDTYRNSIYHYVTVSSAGGEWLEGYEYSHGGTMKLLLLGVDAINTWTDTDNFPEVTAWKEDAAVQFIHTLTPNSATGIVQPYLWGDTQSPRTFRDFYYYETALVMAAAVGGTATGPLMQDWVLDREEAYTVNTLDPYPRGFFMFDPYATRGDWTTLATTKYVSGVQMLNAKTGWGASDSWFTAHYMARVGADHVPTYWGEFQLWKNGKWAITHPQCYGGTCIDARGTNGLTFDGVPVGQTYGVKEYRGAPATRTESSPVNFTYIVGTQGGDIWGNHRYGGTASYIMEHTRSLVWLRDWDVIVAFDRGNAKVHTFATASVAQAFKDWSDARPRKELYISTPVSPTQTSNYTDWIYDGATAHTRVTHLLPASITHTIEADGGVFNGGTVPAGEAKFHVRVVPDPDTNQWETFLNVWDAYGTGTPVTVTVVDDAENVQGAVITRGTTNIVTLFNSTQGQDIPGPVPVGGGYWDYVTTEPTTATILGSVRLRNTGYEVTYTAGVGTATKIMLFDLNPTGEWTSQINGGTVTPIMVSAEGTGIVESSVTGSVTLTVAVTGIDLPIEITTANLPQAVVGAAYSQPIAAQFGDGGPYTCSIDSGALPVGLTLPAATACTTGITGTPTAPTNDSSLIKTATQAWGNAGAASTNSLASGDGYVETTAVETTTYRMFGLSNGDSTTSYIDIDFGLYLRADAGIMVYEGGTLKFTGGTYTTGDVMRVAVVSGAVKYSKNGTVFYTSLTSPTYPLLADTAFYTTGSTLGTVVFEDGGGPDPVAWTGMSGVSQTGGSASFVVEACDSVPSCATRLFSLAVRDIPIITTLTFDVGTVGAAYNDSCTASGGTEPYVFIVGDGQAPDDEAGELPSGLDLNASTCAITGTPITLGTYEFTLRVTDDVAEFDEVSRQITINQATALVGMGVRGVPSATAAVITFGVAGLQNSDSCTVYLKDDEATLDQVTSASGRSRRRVYFTGLQPDKIFGVDVICGEAQSERAFFRTYAAAVGGTVSWKYTKVPPPYLAAQGAAKLTVEYNLPGEAASSVTDASCSSGCTVTLSLTSGAIYEIRHKWLTAADALLATSELVPYPVP